MYCLYVSPAVARRLPDASGPLRAAYQPFSHPEASSGFILTSTQPAVPPTTLGNRVIRSLHSFHRVRSLQIA
jgi:hypothetical protein